MNEGTYRDVLVLHVPNTLQHASPDCIAQILSGGLGVDVPEVDRPVQRLIPVHASKTVHAVHAIHSSKVGGEGQVGGHGRPKVSLVLDGREGSLGNK